MKLNKGDILYCNVRFSDAIRKVRIIRTTKTQAITDTNIRFKREYDNIENGFLEIGNHGYNNPFYYLENDKLIQDYERYKLKKGKL